MRRKIKMELQLSDDKENQAPNRRDEPLLESLVRQLPVPIMRYTETEGHNAQLLHLGESARSLFMLEKATERRLRLVIALKDAPRSVTQWLELLRCPLGGNPGKYNKIRLLRRALTCTDSETARASAEYTEMCIMLAKLSDSELGIRQNFQEMKKRRVGEQQPLRYEEEAAFEFEAGNKRVAEEVLELGVVNGALTGAQKEELWQRVVAGRAGWVAAFSGSPQEQRVLALRTKMQVLRRTQDCSMTDKMMGDGKAAAITPRGGASTPLRSSIYSTPGGYRTGRDARTSTPVYAVTPAQQGSPVSHARYGSGFSTVSKAPRTGNVSSLLTTPSLPTRSGPKSQSTLRKPTARFTLGGPPLRVIASNRDDEDDDDNDEDATLGNEQSLSKSNKAMSSIKEANDTPSVLKSDTISKPKIDVGDISHILKWNPAKSVDAKGCSVGGKDARLPICKRAKPMANGKQLKNCGGETKGEKSLEAQPVPPVGVQWHTERKELSDVRTKMPTSVSNSTAFDRLRSPKMKELPDGKADATSGSCGLLNSSGMTAHDRYRSPKRQQLDPSVAMVKTYADIGSPVQGALSPQLRLGSPSSVSSSSSPPVASMSSASSRDALDSLTSRVVVNGLRYIKLEQIGSGGSSKVYRMLGPDLKIYALKKIKLKKLDAQSIAQYTNEINLLQRLQGNPHIIKLIAAEQDLQQRQINVIMEHGEIDLSERLRNLKGGMDENLLRVIWTQMLQAVDAIHRMRIIHGDLKPANFLFVNGALKLIDFGIAKAIPSNDTTNIERDSQIGTVNFMSPEAIQGNTMPNGDRDPKGKMKVGRASDIWSLGCILYQIVYSKPPFADVHNIIEKFRCIIDPAVPIPFPPLRNKDLEDVIRSCLQREHRRRPPITGEGGLLTHSFLQNAGSGAPVSSTAIVTTANASQVLSQLGGLLRSQGVPAGRVDMFMSIGQEGLQNANSSGSSRIHCLYNTQERQTDI
uniref:Protein kinase domain-containing protein n=1 Tax=Peronospora matthiolae TaxID=2874970 RepID=A0AAV1UIY8_9STRA